MLQRAIRKIVYAIVQAKKGGIFRSDDGGAHWKLVNDSMEMRQRAFYYMAIYADPTDPNTIYVPNARFFVSHDGGKNFGLLRPPHGDNHIVWIDPHNPQIILEGNDGGATVSADRGETWSSEHNQLTAQFYHVALDEAFPFNIYGAQQDEGSFEGPSASSSGSDPHHRLETHGARRKHVHRAAARQYEHRLRQRLLQHHDAARCRHRRVQQRQSVSAVP